MRSTTLKSILQFGSERAVPVILVIVLALVIGLQISNPNKRFIEAIIGIVFVTLIARYPLVWSLSFFIIMYPFPFALRVGNSNVVFLPLIVIVWLIRVAMKNVERPIGALFDRVVLLMIFSYIISFYNNPGGKELTFGIVYFLTFLTTVGFGYLIVNFARDSKNLERVMFAEIIGCAFVILFCILELLFPGRTLIPNWLYTGHKQALIMKDIRILGPFGDFELQAEYIVLNIPIVLFFFVRTKRLLFRWAYFGLLLLCVGMLMATSTRGAFISLSIGLVYMLWCIRRDLDIVKVTAIALLAVGMFAVSELVVSRYTISGGLMYRLRETKFKGYMPDTRARAWPAAFERAKKHILIGQSPAWNFDKKLQKFTWPHNVYLFYLNMTGIVGLCIFLVLLYKLLMATLRARAPSMFDPSFARALMLILHIDLVIFMIDQIKIDYLRNMKYIYFIWFLFGAIAATWNVVRREQREANRIEGAEPSGTPSLERRTET